MSTIGVLGANSQVGTEVCLHLTAMDGVEVVPICRTKPAAAFLKRCGLECRVGEMSDLAGARELLDGCDTVVEFSRPNGEASQILAATRTIVGHAIEAAPPRSRYVFISSIMAFGMEQNTAARKTFLLSRTVYGRTKRYGERYARRLGRRAKREVYVLRLGDVHGELQSVSRSAARQLRDERTLVPAGPSYAIFAHSVAEALRNIAGGQEAPGRYTLVADPEFTWKELHEHYCRRAGIRPVIEEFEPARPASRILSGPLAAAYRRREMIAAYLLCDHPQIERRLRAIHSRRRAAAQIEEMDRALQYRPYQPTFVGRLPGKRLKSLSDGRRNMDAASQIVRTCAQKVADGCRSPEVSKLS